MYNIQVLRCGPVVQLVRTLACHARGRGFESHPGRHTSAVIAQSVERILGKDEVGGSNPPNSSKVYPCNRNGYRGSCFILKLCS